MMSDNIEEKRNRIEILNRKNASGIMDTVHAVFGDEEGESDIFLWRLPEVERRSGYKKTQIYKLMASGDFPRSYKIGPRARAWKSNEVIGWIKSRPRVA